MPKTKASVSLDRDKVTRARLIRRVGVLSDAKLVEACRALRFAMAC